MKIKIQLQIVNDDDHLDLTEEIAVFEKSHQQLADMGLTLSESKTLLKQLQHHIVEQQATTFVSEHRGCQQCDRQRRIKGYTSITFRTVFGNVQLKSPQLYQCPCHPQAGPKTFSPLMALLPEHTAPELLLLETKWASLMAYGLTADLIKDVLPVDEKLNGATIRNHLHRVAERNDAELGEERVFFVDGCPSEWEQLPRPDMPITVGLDGSYIRSWKDKGFNFEMIVGKSLPEDQAQKYFGFVQTYDQKPKRRLFELLKSQGLQTNQQLVFLSDGGDSVRDLQMYLNPDSEHLLDWFHVTMRITVLGQYLKGVKHYDVVQGTEMAKTLESIKWYLWYGNVFRAMQEIESLEWDVEALEIDYPKLSKMAKAIREFRVYIEQNAGFIPNYGERWRYGEAISTAFVESSVNAVVNKRFNKKQQMQWSRHGAHLLLQTRTRVLNDELAAQFEQWYPGFEQEDTHNTKVAA